jgi:hypothetical protein
MNIYEEVSKGRRPQLARKKPTASVFFGVQIER